MSTATHKHRAAFTLALRTVSPSLSALHASRLRLLPTGERERALGPDRPQPPPLTTLTCVQCGHASVRVRVVRLKTGKGKQKPRIITDRNRDQDKGRKRENLNKVTDEYNARKEEPSRVLERTCTMCAFVEHIPIPRGAAVFFNNSSMRKARRVARSRSGEPEMVGKMSCAGGDASGSGASSLVSSGSPGPGTTPQRVTTLVDAQPPHTPPPHTPPVQSLPPAFNPPPRKRPKKKSGLQELLERNRQRQDAAARGKAPGGLSSFLDEL